MNNILIIFLFSFYVKGYLSIDSSSIKIDYYFPEGVKKIEIFYEYKGKDYLGGVFNNPFPQSKELRDSFIWVTKGKWRKNGNLKVVVLYIDNRKEEYFISGKSLILSDFLKRDLSTENLIEIEKGYYINSSLIKTYKGPDPYSWHMLGYKTQHIQGHIEFFKKTSEKERTFISLYSGPSIYSSDTLGNGIFLSFNLIERIQPNWFIGIGFEQYFRQKDRVARIWIPEQRVIEHWLNVSSLGLIFSWGKEYPRVAMKMGICYIYGRTIIAGISSSPVIYDTRKFKPIIGIGLSETFWLWKIPLGIRLETTGGVIFLKRFYGEIGAGIIYKLGRLK